MESIEYVDIQIDSPIILNNNCIDMGTKVSLKDKRQMVRMRAMDYSKQEIADEVGVSRNTVNYHLNKIREEVESHETREMKLAEFLFEPDELVPFVLEEADNPLGSVDLDDISVPLGRLLGGNDS